MIYQVFLSSPYTSTDILSDTPVSCLYTCTTSSSGKSIFMSALIKESDNLIWRDRAWRLTENENILKKF